MLHRRNRHNRLSTEINAGSMADIAFLLLIFFLVTSQIGSDRGLLVKLPPISQSFQEDVVEARNIMSVKVLADGSLKIKDKDVKYEDLKIEVQNFVLNPAGSTENAATPVDAVISFSHDDNTPYEFFIKVYNEMQESYNEMRNDLAKKQYNRDFKSLSDMEKEAIRKAIPVTITEAVK
jgi:biopolymer transport protein ExbD